MKIEEQIKKIAFELKDIFYHLSDKIDIEYFIKYNKIHFKLMLNYKKYKYWTILISEDYSDNNKKNYYINLYRIDNELIVNKKILEEVKNDLLERINEDYIEHKKDMIKLEKLAEKVSAILTEMEFKFEYEVWSPDSIYFNNINFFYNGLWSKYLYGRVSNHLPIQNGRRKKRDFNLLYTRSDNNLHVEDKDLDILKKELMEKKEIMKKDMD